MSDQISIVSLKAVRDSEGAVILDARLHDLLIPYVTFFDALAAPLDALDAWWAEREPAVGEALAGFLADPPEPVDMPIADESTRGQAGVGVPIPRAIVAGPTYDVVGETVPEIKDAVLMAIGHERGDHARCRGAFEPCQAGLRANE